MMQQQNFAFKYIYAASELEINNKEYGKQMIKYFWKLVLQDCPDQPDSVI